MGLPWVRLDCDWYSNLKFLDLIADRKHKAVVLYLAGLAWSGGHGMAGYIPRSTLPMIHGTKREADQLVEARLWAPDQGGWQINDWDEYQKSTEENQKRSDNARKAATIRWGKHTKQEAAAQLKALPDA